MSVMVEVQLAGIGLMRTFSMLKTPQELDDSHYRHLGHGLLLEEVDRSPI